MVISAISGLITVRTEQQHLLNAMITGADQLSKSITSATWHAMLDDHREAAYEVMQTIGRKQGIDRIRMFNRTRPAGVFHGARRIPAAGPTRATRPILSGSIRIFSGPDGRRNLAMVTPISKRGRLQPGGLPCASGRSADAGRAGPVAEPGFGGPRNRTSEGGGLRGHRHRNSADRHLHLLFHAAFCGRAHPATDRGHQGGQRHGSG